MRSHLRKLSNKKALSSNATVLSIKKKKRSPAHFWPIFSTWSEKPAFNISLGTIPGFQIAAAVSHYAILLVQVAFIFSPSSYYDLQVPFSGNLFPTHTANRCCVSNGNFFPVSTLSFANIFKPENLQPPVSTQPHSSYSSWGLYQLVLRSLSQANLKIRCRYTRNLIWPTTETQIGTLLQMPQGQWGPLRLSPWSALRVLPRKRG